MLSLRLGIRLALACAGFSLFACSSNNNSGGSSGGDACQQACNKLESCSPGTVCSISGPCTGGNKQIADCINQAACNETQQCILGGGGSGGGSGGGTGAGGAPNTGGAGGACGSIDGSWDLTGTCGVSQCDIMQNGCNANFLCDSGSASFAGSVTASSVHFVGVEGTCDAAIDGDALSGSCNGPAGVCVFNATRQ